MARGLEWTINMGDGTSKVLVSECTSGSRILRGLQGFVMGFVSKIGGFFQRAWRLGVNEPKKVIHCVKVGLALSLVSLFYYMRPLYEGVGGNAMWAVMTVVVVFEYTVGASLCKCVNRATGTFLAGALGVGVHWVASHSGERFEPIILQGSVFLLATAATFSRFIPSIKARFDYGAMIFILTFSLVSVSGYRVEKLFELAHHRLSTIAIGTSICLITTMLFCPVWAGTELHNLIKNNMEKLSDSLDGCVTDYFTTNKTETSDKRLQGYKCALNSKATEESLANFARWEPAHGGFNFGHPWKEYVKVGASLRSCAYCIEALNGSINSEAKAPDALKNHLSHFCMRLSSKSSAVMKELAAVIATMKKSTKIDFMVEEMRSAVQELEGALKSLSKQPIQAKIGEAAVTLQPIVVTLVEVVPLVTVSSLLIEIAARTEKLAGDVSELAEKAEFEAETAEEAKKAQNSKGQENEDDEMMTLQKV
ncbi:aluminum activated malate transporter family protein [Perilla frutescens var. hirtella]|uniref:Aluminum activated malate transporter family protein n=1 Tax=Perilla frutescens var. hirtella TaxID=608512 RepID=A0AAD4PD97_PERFH|nr:aluminum activated malate transporter family protein [Perilla frutescens var. hirtella]